jgi:Fe-coproporphyrin III synthase
VNNVCNLHCKMCDVGTGFEASNFHFHLTGARPINMPAELAARAVDQTARHFPRARIGYAFTEPLVWPHLAGSVAHATSRGLRTSVTTNGLKLRALYADLARAGLRDLFVSLDGPPEVHDRIRGHAHSFAWAFEGIERTCALPTRPEVSVFCAITEWNTGRLRELLEILRPLPLAQVGFMHTNYTTAATAEAHNAAWGHRYAAAESNLAELSLDRIDLDELWGELSAIRAARWPFRVTMSPDLPTRADLEDFYRRPERRFARVCGDSFTNLMVKSDGTAIPAHGRCYRVVAGNLHDTELDALWNAPPLARFREDLRRAGGLMPACTRCCSAMGRSYESQPVEGNTSYR